jgi:hypothetical protein
VAKQMTRLNVSLTANTGNLSRGMKRASKIVGRFSNDVTRVARALTSPLALITGGLTAAGLLAKMRSAANGIDALAKASDKLGISTQALAGFRHAAEQTGIGADQATVALQRMVRRISEAAQGTGEARSALRELGLSAKELAALSPDQQFRAIAGAMSNVAQQGDRVRLAMRLFDTEGVALVNTLSLGTDGLDKMAEEAGTLGLAISRVDAKKIEQANDAMDRAGKAIDGAFAALAIRFAPAIEEAANRFTAMTADAERFGELSASVFDGVIKAIGFVADAVYSLRLVWKGLQVGLAKIGRNAARSFNDLAKGAQWVTQFVERIGETFEAAASVIGAVFDAPMAAVKLAFSGLVSFIASSVNSVLDNIRGMAHEMGMKSLVEQTERGMDAMNAMAQAADDMADGAEGADAIRQSMDRLSDVVTADFAPVHGIQALNDAIAQGSKGIWELEEQIQAMKDAGMPSERIKAFVAEVEKAANKAAAAVNSIGKVTDDASDPMATLDSLLNAELERIRKHNEQKLNVLNDFGIREREQIMLQEKIKRENLRMAFEQGMLTKQEMAEAEIQLVKQREEAIKKLEQQRREFSLADASRFANESLNLANQFGDQAIGLQKTISLVQSGISIATGIARAQELGFPQNLAEMARVAAVGVKVASQIQGASRGAAQVSSGVSTSTGQAAASAGGTAAPAGGQATGATQPGQLLYLESGAYLRSDAIADLLNDAIERNVRITGVIRG